MMQHRVKTALTMLGVLAACVWFVGGSAPAAAAPPLRPINDDEVRAHGIRKIVGKHLTLYTNLAEDEQIDILPQVFDLAVPQWCAYFGINPAMLADWHIRGCLIKDIKDRNVFEAVGLLPAELPPFHNGYSMDRELWLYQQQSDYYRRHLLLHEGTHGFMNEALGGSGSPWYREGMAEMSATHAYQDGQLRLGYFPARREEVPRLGRIELVQTATATGGVKPLGAVLNYDNRAHLENEPYAWCWALAKFLDTHARYQERFRSLPRHVRDLNFTERFSELFARDWSELDEEWQLFAGSLQYGHDIARTAIDFKPGVRLAASGASVDVLADRGWQNSGLRLVSGNNYRFTAEGRFQVDDKPMVWWSEPGGVTIRYHDGRPLGMLLGVVRPGQPRRPRSGEELEGRSPFLAPFEIGTGTTLKPEVSGTLYLKINDSPGELDDNAGRVQVRVSAF